MNTKKILVTGSEGNIGKVLVPYLRKCGHEVLCLDILQKYRDDYILCNILDINDAIPTLNKFKPQVVFHLAAMVSRITSERSPHMAINTNITGTSAIIALCLKYNARLINFSTSEVYGNDLEILNEDQNPNPNNIYGLTKLMTEHLCNYFKLYAGLNAINVRPFMLYDENENFGENRSAMIRFVENIIRGIPITVHQDTVRSWMHMNDAVVMFEKLIYIPNEINEINIGNPQFEKIQTLAQMICQYTNQPETLINIQQLPPQMTKSKISDFKIQKNYINYQPQINLQQGVKKVIDNVKKIIDFNDSLNPQNNNS